MRSVRVAAAAAASAGNGASEYCSVSGMTIVSNPRLSIRRALLSQSSPEPACAATTPKRNLRVDMSCLSIWNCV